MSTAPSHASPPELGAPASGARRQDIQGLRAVAVLMVVAFHAGLSVPGGFVGVDVFFVISGFVITAMLLREWAATGRIRLGRFYIRRFKRLTPALALTVSVTMALAVFFLSPLGTQQDTARTGIGAMLLAANLVIAKITGGYFDLEAETNALLNTWSLSVEEQFYLGFPLLLLVGCWVGARSRRTQWAPGALVVAVGGVSLGLALLGASGFVLPREAWLLGFYSPLTRAWEFAAGALLAIVAARPHVRSPRLASGLAVSGSALLAIGLVVIDEDSQFPGLLTLLPVLGTMALIQAGLHGQNRITRALSSTPMVRVGDWSYSIYLWHWPLIVISTLRWPSVAWAAPLAAAFSLLPAIASYRWVESPLRSYTPASRPRLAGLVAATVAVPLVMATGLWQAATHGFGDPKIQEFQAAVFAQPDVCPIVTGLSPEAVRECTWNPTATGSRVYLLGDSNAGQFIDAVGLAAADLDRPVIASTTNACPFLDVRMERRDRPKDWNAYCRAYTVDTLEFLQSADPGLVILSNIDTYWDDPLVTVAVAEGVTNDPGRKLEAFRVGLTATVEALQRDGHEVLVVQTIPRWSGNDTWRTAACTAGDISGGRCLQTMPTSNAESRQGSVRRVVQSVSGQAGARVLDLWPFLCKDTTCSTQGPDFPRYYRDGLHISVPQGVALAPDLTRATAA